MKKTKNSILFYLPRILTIFFAIFLSIFAFDVFESGKGLFEILIDFIIHLTPTFLIIIILIFSWKREWVGGLFYIMLSFLYIISFWGRFSSFLPYLIISGLLFLMGILFWLNYFKIPKNGT